MNLGKKFRKTLVFLLAFYMVLQGTGYDVAAWEYNVESDDISLNSVEFVFDIKYVDNEGNEIANGSEVTRRYEKEEAKVFSLERIKIDGYNYAGYEYEIEASGRKSSFNTDSNPTISIDITTEDVKSGVCRYTVYMEYYKIPKADINDGATVHINYIDYTFNVKYINLEANEIYDSYTEMTKGIKSTFSPKIVDITEYKYAGYYYTNETGEEGINSEGSLSSLLHGSTPVITPHSEGKDAVNGAGTYTVYIVYAQDTPYDYDFYGVEYDANGGEGEVIDLHFYQANEEVTVLGGAELSRAGYNFIGWNTSADGNGTEYIEGDTFAIITNTILYAQWDPVIELDDYSVKYDANGGVGEVTDTNLYKVNDTVTVLSGKALSRTGYTFTGWNTAADGKGTGYAEGDTFALTGDTTLYAQWKAQGLVIDDYKVTYDANGGVGEVIDPNSYAMNDTVTVLSGKVLSREGYTFSGWNTAADGKGTSYLAGTTFTITEDTTLYAQWTKNGAADIKTETTASGNGNVASAAKTTAVKTGDESSSLTHLAVMIFGFTLIFITLYWRRRGKREQDV